MNSSIQGLEPKLVWEHFYQISQIPRESGNETAVGEYVISVAKRNNLPFKKDKLGNIIVSCPASKGKENSTGVVLQGHTDMVCEKNNETVHDFNKDPIKLVVDGEWMHADGTTLGADNGIGVCYALAVMDDHSFEHPPLEFLFTVDEETGLTGATGLEPGFVEGKILINLDTEEEGAFYIGCAGGKHTYLRKKIEWEDTPKDSIAVQLKVGGLKGGHSGMDIVLGLGNSIKLLSRFLFNLKDKITYRLVSINGGNKHNAIPREAEAIITVSKSEVSTVIKYGSEMDGIFKNELQFTDKNVFLEVNEIDNKSKVISKELQNSLINLIYAMPHGVIEMSHTIDGLVETSTNMAVVKFIENTVELLASQRSSVDSAIIDIANKVRAIGEIADFEIEQGGGYPAWQPNPDSALLKKCKNTYEKLTGRKSEVKAVHAGLECGIIGAKYTGMDMISFGPIIQKPHSPDERVHIESVSRCWDYLLELIKTF